MSKTLVILALLSSIFAFPSPSRSADVSYGSFKEFVTRDQFGRDIKYYLSKSKTKGPLIVLIQGSGCEPVFYRDGANFISSSFAAFQFAEKGKYNVLLIEKPFAATSPTISPGSATNCPDGFNSDFSANSWQTAIETAIKKARKNSTIDKSKTMLLGESEGAVIAGKIAHDNSFITHIGLIGVSGSIQAFDFVINAYNSDQSDAEKIAKIEFLKKTEAQIISDPQSQTKFAWGHTYKRWSSFYKIALDELLPKTKANIYVLLGMKDKSAPSLGTELLLTKLEFAGRSAKIRRLSDTGHTMIKPGGSYDDLGKEYELILDWFEENI